MKTIKGKFEVKATPLPADEVTQAMGVMRMRFDKVFSGAIEATSTVTMMGVLDRIQGSGGYVAIEKLEGAIDGKKGSFYLQHSSSMDRGVTAQKISVIPDSGADELTGLRGEMIIDIENGAHFYTFHFATP